MQKQPCGCKSAA